MSIQSLVEDAQPFIALLKIYWCCDIELDRPGTSALYLRRGMLNLRYMYLTTEWPSRCGMLIHVVLFRIYLLSGQ